MFSRTAEYPQPGEFSPTITDPRFSAVFLTAAVSGLEGPRPAFFRTAGPFLAPHFPPVVVAFPPDDATNKGGETMEALLAVLRVFDVLALLSGAVRFAEDAAKAHPQFQDNPPAQVLPVQGDKSGNDKAE